MKADFYYTNQTPTANSDTAHGYAVGNTWCNQTASTDQLYVCTVATNGAAVWAQQNNQVKAASGIITNEVADDGVNRGYWNATDIATGIKAGSVLETQDTTDEGVNSGFWNGIPTQIIGIRLGSIIMTYSNSNAAQIIRYGMV